MVSTFICRSLLHGLSVHTNVTRELVLQPTAVSPHQLISLYFRTRGGVQNIRSDMQQSFPMLDAVASRVKRLPDPTWLLVPNIPEQSLSDVVRVCVKFDLHGEIASPLACSNASR